MHVTIACCYGNGYQVLVMLHLDGLTLTNGCLEAWQNDKTTFLGNCLASTCSKLANRTWVWNLVCERMGTRPWLELMDERWDKNTNQPWWSQWCKTSYAYIATGLEWGQNVNYICKALGLMVHPTRQPLLSIWTERRGKKGWYQEGQFQVSFNNFEHF